MGKLLSVIVPVYNVSKYLDRCIESILSQSYDDIEVILVDDGSTDESGEICDNWQKKENRILVIHKMNGGLASARNSGLDHSHGELIAFVDGDDSISKDMYRSMISEMENDQADIACCGKNKIYDSGKKVVTQNCDNKMVFNTSDAIGNLLTGISIDESACDKVFSKKIFDNIRFPEGEINEDLVIMPILFSRSKTIVHVGRPFYNYYQNSGSITRSAYSEKAHVYIEHLLKIESFVEKEFKELKDDYLILLCRYSCSLMYRIYSQKNGKKEYRKDFNWYKKSFNKSFPVYIRYDGLSGKDRILSVLMYIGLGRPFSMMNTFRKKIKKDLMR